eukprot:CAMPEP_0167755516 /NCGR_PEP_ID=MMETSP0110_2-20121227/8871_1 /TAXON_ID=629695 /ORGANISM="Gymnochlora sp., Strain CCMP2014" /LENGTH=213 /DNA_ID=CAMNT_0007641519 /DNA_START=30 /DNA_END=671 /DNA_ORIENTATION=-
MSESKRVFAKESKKGNPKYLTYDDDRVLGAKAPDLSNMEYLTDVKVYPKIEKGDIVVLFVWGQFQKACYPKIKLYSKLADAFKTKKVKVIGLSTDPDTSYAKKWLDDPKKKYSTVFETKFAVTFDTGKKIKEYLSMTMRAPLNVPHTFVIKDDKIVWHQQHSELGATAPTYMWLMEDQLELLLAGKDVSLPWGKNPVEEDEDEDEDEEEDDDE